jgi:hypothetical protein
MLTLSNPESVQDADLASFLASQVPDEPEVLTWPLAMDPSWLDPQSPDVRANPVLLARVLEAKYRKSFERDALETGHCEIHNGQCFYRTKLGLPQFAGLVLEAYVVRRMMENPFMLQVAITWCSRSSHITPGMGFVRKYLPVGTGLEHTRSAHLPWFDSRNPRFDIMFLKKVSAAKRRLQPDLPAFEPLTIEGTTIPAGIQIKAITGREEEEIVTPLINGTYSHVLTLLTHANGKHSYHECQRLLGKALQDKRIDRYTYMTLSASVCCPQQLSLNQNEIDGYYQYIAQWMDGRVHTNAVIADGLAAEVKEERYGASLMLPSTEIIAPAPFCPVNPH